MEVGVSPQSVRKKNAQDSAACKNNTVCPSFMVHVTGWGWGGGGGGGLGGLHPLELMWLMQ